VGAALMIAEGSTVLIWTLYFVAINRDAFYLIWFVVIINILVAPATFWVLESPRYLFGMERYEDARQILVKYA
jgi:predicted ABC-type sugar transport system permease subunit